MPFVTEALIKMQEDQKRVERKKLAVQEADSGVVSEGQKAAIIRLARGNSKSKQQTLYKRPSHKLLKKSTNETTQDFTN